jgi:DNA adenine methylase
MSPRSPAIRYHGGKFRLAPWILSFFPPHRCYVEPFGGAASVLLHKERSYAEVYNDLDGDMVNFFSVLRNPAQRDRLIELCVLTPFARAEFELAYEDTDDPVERARRVAIRAAMGFGSAGATKNNTGFRVDTRRSYGTAQHIWAKYPEHLAVVGSRMAAVLIENRPAKEIMLQHDDADTLHYCDPPYVLSTRDPRASSINARYYRHEMSDEQHVEFLTYARKCVGMVIVSGYDNAIYADLLKDWEKHETSARISAGRGAGLRVESLWMNAACSDALRRPRTQRELIERVDVAGSAELGC